MTQTFDLPTTRTVSSAPETSDDEVARTLLIELLAHQFCYPVQWIDTQDFILGPCSTQRVIEMGPANTLANMAKRTIAMKYASKDMATGVARELLTFQQDLDAISYHQPQEDEAENAMPAPFDKTHEAVSPPPQTQNTDANSTPSPPPHSGRASAQIEDSPPTTTDIITAIIATALKKPWNTSNLTQSIKALCAGRSTLQNEIIGDLDAEFSSLPDGAEDQPLESLCQELQARFSGKLGKKSTSLMDRMTSQKLPASFQAATFW